MFIAHKSDDGKVQFLKDHLEGVAKLAEEFAKPFGAGNHARRAALLHDAGKYSVAGQRRMNDPEHTAKVDHSTAGAKIALEILKDAYVAEAIAGHHGGLMNLGGKLSAEGDGTLRGRCRKELSGDLDASAYWEENKIDYESCIPEWLRRDRNSFSDQFYTRMLFSCLVDADFLDTEKFMKPDNERMIQHLSPAELFTKLMEYITPWLQAPQREINRKRNEIIMDAINAASQSPGLYTLTVPTGGGKTVSSLAFALAHAAQNQMKRIIYVIPYTSIIEQNAAVFKSILGEQAVLEHHCGMITDPTDDVEDNLNRRKMLATENWDAEVIVTTAVQFFESLFSNRPSKCRKLHNIANSVIIFDEAQMMPLQYLKPCIRAIAELINHYQVTAVLCTATQPSLERFFKEYKTETPYKEICNDVTALQTFFRRVHFRDAGPMNIDQISSSLQESLQILCIVNSRKTAQQLYRSLMGEGNYHLSTWMTPNHRSKKLKEIRDRLRQKLPCRVISTSLLEAGVDVDFPQVWREKAGLDSILQAAGRCNREGVRSSDDSEVVIFSFEDNSIPPGLRTNRKATDLALASSGQPDDQQTVQIYFDQLYRMNGEGALDTHEILEKCRKNEFGSIAEEFHLIEDNSRTIYIPEEGNEKDITALKAGKYSKDLLRRLARSAVNVALWDWNLLVKQEAVFQLDESSGILANPAFYDEQTGIRLEMESGELLFI